MLLGLRVLERMKVEYADAGGSGEEVNPFVLKARRGGREGGAAAKMDGMEGVEMGGGFVASGDEEDEPHSAERSNHIDHAAGGGFIDDDETQNADYGGGFLVENGLQVDDDLPPSKNCAPITPVSLQSLHKPGDDVDGLEGEDGEESVVPHHSELTSRRSRPQADEKPKSKPKARSRDARRETMLSDDDEESSLSELSSPREAVMTKAFVPNGNMTARRGGVEGD